MLNAGKGKTDAIKMLKLLADFHGNTLPGSVLERAVEYLKYRVLQQPGKTTWQYDNEYQYDEDGQ